MKEGIVLRGLDNLRKGDSQIGDFILGLMAESIMDSF
jgi:hypothetical protein